MLRLAFLVAALVCTLAVAACGEDDAQQAAPEGVSGEVGAIAEATKEAQRDLAAAQDRLQNTAETLADRAGEDARDLADRLRRELPEVAGP